MELSSDKKNRVDCHHQFHHHHHHHHQFHHHHHPRWQFLSKCRFPSMRWGCNCCCCWCCCQTFICIAARWAGCAPLALLENHNVGCKSTRHYGRKQPRIQTVVLGHSLVRSLVPSHRSLVRLLRTARFARALRCAHSFARSLTSLTPSLVGKWLIRLLFCLCFFFIFDHSALGELRSALYCFLAQSGEKNGVISLETSAYKSDSLLAIWMTFISILLRLFILIYSPLYFLSCFFF